MFLTDKEYFLKLIQVPGGLADYISEFMVQYYHYPVVGALMLATITTGIAVATYTTSRCLSKGNVEFSILHTLPALAIWYAMHDINVMHSTIVAILMSLLISWLCAAALRGDSKWLKWLSMAMIPAGYFLLGPAIYIALIVTIIGSIRHKTGLIYAAAATMATIITMAVCIHNVLYPVPRFLYGICYFRYHDFHPGIMLAIIAAASAPAIGLLKLSQKKLASAAQAAALIIMALMMPKYYDKDTQQIIRYLKLAHECKWNDIIEDASENTPRLAQAMTMVNMALAFEEKLTDQMQRYPQFGMEGLLPVQGHDMLTPLLSAEAMFWMGLNDYAMHSYFESKTGNPTYRGSIFSTMRLAECYMVDENYAVALKYLLQLRKTTFYKAKAEEYINLILAEQTDSNPMIMVLKSIKLKKNRVQASSKIAESIRDLLQETPGNYLAYQYLMAIQMLEGNTKNQMQ